MDRIRDLRQYHADVVLKDGSTVHLRPIQPDDDDAWLFLFSRLSPQTIYYRFHHVIAEVTRAEAQTYTNVDYENTFALVAILGEPPDERIIAIGRFARLANPERAESAFLVEDSHQGRGISTHLLEHLATAAREKGIKVFEAEVLGENKDMMRVFRDFGFQVDAQYADGTYHVVFPIEQTEVVEERSVVREQIAATTAISAFFHPRQVAVIGASRERGTIGAEIFHNILRNGYKGAVYPVNPSATVVGAVHAYPSVLDVPDDVDLAVIVVPAEHVLDVTGECARKGVRGIVLISSGFKEMGPEGVERERTLMSRVHSYGMRLVGPNCLGVLNTNPDVSLNATFAALLPPQGNVALLSQSGALGLALLDYASKLGIGLSSFASIGNAADVSSNDLVQYWEQDPLTSVILLYLESFGNPRRFSRLARRVAAVKPIVAIKGGRTTAGSRAASSHTGALAGLDVAADALFRQAGVIRTDTLEEMFDIANLLAHQPLPQGRRVAILTNSGGPGILAADACERYGLNVPPASEATREKLRAFLPAAAGLSNPFDLLAPASAEDYDRALRIVLEDDDVDSVIVIFIPPLVTRAEDVAAAVRDVAAESSSGKPLLACFMSAQGAPPQLRGEGEEIVPAFAFPEATAISLARVCDYAEWRRQPKGTMPKLEALQTEKGQEIVQRALAGDKNQRVWLPMDACAELLGAYGIRSAKVRLAGTADEAAAAATEIGFPVAAKVASATITHKTDIGGVVLGLQSAQAVRDAFRLMEERLSAIGKRDEMDGVIVQEMVEGGIEAIIGVTQDPSFGPLIMFGLGGVQVELLKDVAFRIHPLTDLDAKDMIRSIKGYPLLDGWRGAPPGDIPALEEVLLRVSALVEDLPEVAEMDLNPVKV
ncbi:MAG: GNAT family N-acetyltransferase, partial [Dehalococcoidia bacterium]